ncbi:1,2-phenylacetyl-CoA epoxidase subunit PaaE [Taibaiella soli]|uniref:Phenylacetate-CoA oxygenase/reductase subunit PaaK n=1 Tax=Taibaiella soli TaxID=1649169 RepID=A0A2W2AYU7_9BACT|nr:1,2-phenylacetyl-CoA epoxidase subunit PaaE [Taibaiella soli]PZF73184.1 phenylacetate-CoA oxygenase/reductase subunit PaaK [Taibaiella soli]
MSALKFYPLTVKDVRPETADCVSISLEVPEELIETFRFAPGQYLTFRTNLENAEVRRSYSICAAPSDDELRVAIKKVDAGRFSTFANELLKAGDTIEVMPPMGKFSPRSSEVKAKNYLAFAAGSGITPIMGIMKHVLETEPESSFTLVYGNKNRNTIIFREAIEGLKNKYMERLRLYHILSREFMDVPLFNGRISGEKCGEFCEHLIDITSINEAFICGPEEMILDVRQKLIDLGLPSGQVHMELFSSPDQPKPKHEKWNDEHKQDEGPMSKVSITLDGATFEMDLAYNGESILDAALQRGADLPYACKGGVCCTCRAKVVAGEVEMEVNYALEPDEIAKGFVLTCQSHPKTDRVVIDFDAR